MLAVCETITLNPARVEVRIFDTYTVIDDKEARKLRDWLNEYLKRLET